jgi:hypothetical protein
MSEIIVNISELGSYTLSLNIIDPDPEEEVWQAIFCDSATGDCSKVYFEMEPDYEVWDLVNVAIETYKADLLLE